MPRTTMVRMRPPIELSEYLNMVLVFYRPLSQRESEIYKNAIPRDGWENS